jgi:acetyl-CoA C-acetyltransferase
MGETAENLAERYSISREAQDELAWLSHHRAMAAKRDGKFDSEIEPVTVKGRKGDSVVSLDEHPRDVSLDELSKLRPAFKKGGTVTAGNSSSINDGAAAILLASPKTAGELGLRPRAKLVATASAGVEPEIMGLGPIMAIPKALQFAGLKMADIGYFELNEAFAAQFLACQREMGISLDIINANGSGIALGHPVGCSGARVIVSLISEMKRRGVRYGAASVCAAGGPATAAIVENLEI